MDNLDVFIFQWVKLIHMRVIITPTHTPKLWATVAGGVRVESDSTLLDFCPLQSWGRSLWLSFLHVQEANNWVLVVGTWAIGGLSHSVTSSALLTLSDWKVLEENCLQPPPPIGKRLSTKWPQARNASIQSFSLVSSLVQSTRGMEILGQDLCHHPVCPSKSSSPVTPFPMTGSRRKKLFP